MRISLPFPAQRESKRWLDIPVTLFCLAIFIYLITLVPGQFVDWQFFHKAPLTDPYSYGGFLNPFWLKWIVAPLDEIAYRYSFAIFISFIIAFVIYIFRDNKPMLFIAITTPQFMAMVVNGQVDGVVLIGYWLLKQNNLLGLPFMLVKPQVMIGSTVTWWIRTSKGNKVISVAIVLALTGIGFVLYGNWIADMHGNIQTDLYHPVSVAPNLPLLGVVIFIFGLWKGNMFISGFGTLFITPYVAMHSLWVYWVAWLMEKPKWKVAVIGFIINWILVIIYM